MQLPIGEVIYKLRKEKGVTQEQLANAVGVSIPAVSKWESGGAYPDITILPSIARYFDTSIDCLLKYEKDISNEDVMKIMTKCAKCFEERALKDAVEMCESFLKQYPNSMFLKLRTGSLYMSYLSKASSEIETKNLIEKAIILLEQSALSSEAEISQSSDYLLSTLYSMNGDDEKAEEVLSRIPRNKIDPDNMLVTIYIKQKKFDEAKKLIQTNIWHKLSGIILELASYSRMCSDEGDQQYAEELLLIQRQLIKLFGIEQVFLQTNSLQLGELYIKRKDVENALNYFQEFAGSILEMNRDLSQHKIFNSVKFTDPIHSDKYINQMILKLFEQNPEFDFIRENEKFKAILEKLKNR